MVVGGDGRLAVPGLHLGLVLVLLCTTASAASDEQENGGDQGKDASGEHTPSGGTEVARAVALVVVADGTSDEVEADEVADEGNGGDDKAKGGREGSQQGQQHAGAQRQKEGNEDDAGSNGVKDHDVGETTGRGLPGAGEVCAINIADQLSNVVANSGIAAAVTVGASVANAPTKGTKIDLGSGQAVAAQVDCEYGQLVHNGSRNVSDDEQSRCCEQQHAAEVVEEDADTHGCG